MSDGVGLTEHELADRADVPVERVRNLVARGVVAPADDGSFSTSDVMRIQVVTSTERAGVTLDDFAAAIARGGLSLRYLDQLPPPAALLPETGQELAAAFDVPFDAVAGAIVAFGLTRPDPEARVRADDVIAYRATSIYSRAGLSGEALQEACRVFGESVRHMAQYQVDLFHTRFEQPYRDEGLREDELLDRAVSEVASKTATLGPDLVKWLYARHSETYAVQHRVEHAERALEEAGLVTRPPTDPPAIVFLDLTGYTALTEREGDEASADVARRLASFVDGPTRDAGGHVVKWLGDGVELFFPDPPVGVRCVLALAADAVTSGLPPAHVGVHVGPVVYRSGDYYGRTVNVAARLAGVAEGGQVVASATTVDACRDSPGLRFDELGAFELRGVAQPMTLFLAAAS